MPDGGDIRRILALIPIWIGGYFIAFVLVHAIPGGPFDTGAIRSRQATENLLHAYHLDKPLFEQYILYIWQVLHGDLGHAQFRRWPGDPELHGHLAQRPCRQ